MCTNQNKGAEQEHEEEGKIREVGAGAREGVTGRMPAADTSACRGMAAAENATPLLKWHGLLVDKCGLGCITRAFAERKTVV